MLNRMVKMASLKQSNWDKDEVRDPSKSHRLGQRQLGQEEERRAGGRALS